MTRVLIVEDQSMPRTLFEMYVNQSENYTLAGSISNADMTDYHCEIPMLTDFNGYMHFNGGKRS